MDTSTFIFLSTILCLALKFLFFNTYKNRRLPPGPPAIPFLARFIWQRKSIFDIEDILRELHAQHGPVVTLRITSRPTIFISDRHLAHQALVQSSATFAHRPPAMEPNHFLTCGQHDISSATYGPFWRLLRRNLTTEILHPSRVKLFAPARRWVLEILMNKLKAGAGARGGEVVVMESFQYAMFCLLVLMCFGEKLDEKAIREMKAVMTVLLLNFTDFPIFSFFPRITKLLFRRRWNKIVEDRRKLEDIFIPLIRARRNRKQQSDEDRFVYSYVDSLLGLSLPEEEGGRKLTEGEMVSLCFEFMTGGTDTTATALQWIMANLVKHQDMQRKLLGEIEGVVGSDGEEVKEEALQRLPYLKAVIMEALRRHPPAHFLLPLSVPFPAKPKGKKKNATVHHPDWIII